MKQPKFKIDDIDYLFIFDYYDYPLSFISKKIEGNYYFFYFIDDYTYFIKRLSIKDISLVFTDVSTRNILEEFKVAEDFNIMEYNTSSDKTLIKTIAEYELEKNVNIEEFFPDEESKFEEDQISGKSFTLLKESYTEFFPDIFKNRDLTVKLIDKDNSNLSNPDIVISTIRLMESYFDGHKEHLGDSLIYPNDKLKMSPFSPGSFNINFKLSEPEETTLFEYHDSLNFDNFILFFDSLINVPPEIVYEDLIYENKEIVKATEQFYHAIKKSNVKIELLNNKKTKFSTLSHSEKADKYFEEFASYASKSEVVDTKEDILKFKGIVTSGSNTRNRITIELLSGRISAKFSKELFKEIKDREKIISLSEMKGKYKKIVSLDSDNNEIDVKYEIVEFTQL